MWSGRNLGPTISCIRKRALGQIELVDSCSYSYRYESEGKRGEGDVPIIHEPHKILSGLSSLPHSAARSLVTVGSRLIRVLQSLMVSMSIPVVRAAAWSRRSRMSSSAACFQGRTVMPFVRS